VTTMSGFEQFQQMVDEDPTSEIDYVSTACRGDLGAVEAFTEFARGQLLFDVDSGVWFHLEADSCLWYADPNKAQACRISGMVWDDMQKFIATNEKLSSEDLEYLRKWGQRLNSHSGREALLRMARGVEHIWVKHSSWNTNPYHVNCLNGLLDLKTGDIREPKGSDFLTCRTRVAYDPTCGTGDLWLKTLDEIFPGDQETIDFLQRSLGYTLLGLPNGEREQKFFFCYGPRGGNGKNTLFDPISEVLGSYAGTAGADTFNYSTSQVPEDLHQLRNTRMILASEPGRRDTMDEEMVKAITGNKEVRTRELYQNSTVWTPKFEVWMLANHYPRVPNSDSLFRRFIIFPFDRVFLEHEQRKGLSRELFETEGSAILNWLIEGAQKWMESGLGEPSAKCKAAWDSFRNSTDVLFTFIKDECEPKDSKEKTQAAAVYQRYRTFCTLNGYHALGRNRFYTEMISKGAGVDEGQGGKEFTNFQLKQDSETTGGMF